MMVQKILRQLAVDTVTLTNYKVQLQELYIKALHTVILQKKQLQKTLLSEMEFQLLVPFV